MGDPQHSGKIVAQWRTPGLWTSGKPLLTASGNMVFVKHFRKIYAFPDVSTLLNKGCSSTKEGIMQILPGFAINVRDKKHIPGGPTSHSHYYHHTRQTQRLT